MGQMYKATSLIECYNYYPREGCVKREERGRAKEGRKKEEAFRIERSRWNYIYDQYM
jgi:hypothetical protein